MNLLKMKIAQKLPLVLIGSALVVGVGIGIAAYMIGLETVDRQRAELSADECAAHDTGNLMFWAAVPGAATVTSGQADIARRSALVR